ncbi:solute carrier family 15 member 3-like [Oscarella lobularis]|uniref:solute carrier family 15 member 3-like n=1 Tax=Oscarella lobularis TaxID=121494 RepID=UPI0033142141
MDEGLLAPDLQSEQPTGHCSAITRFNQGRRALAILLFIQTLQGAALWSITLSVITYSTFFLNFSPKAVTATSIIVTGTSYVLSLPIAWFADRKVGCFVVLAVALPVYTAGAGLIAASALKTKPSDAADLSDRSDSYDIATFVSGIVLAGFGASSVRAVLMPYMLDQLGDGSQRRSVIASFCTISFFFINVGAVLAIGLGLWLCREPRFWVQTPEYHDSYNFFWLFLIAPVCLLGCCIALVFGKSTLITRYPCADLGARVPSLRSIIRAGCCFSCERRDFNVRVQEGAVQQQSAISALTKSLSAFVPVLSSLVIYYMTDAQYSSSFTEQSLHMNIYKNGSYLPSSQQPNETCNMTTASQHDSNFSPLLVTIINPLMFLLFLPIYQWIIRPLWEVIAKKEMTLLDRILFGMIVALLACLSATLVELFRVKSRFYFLCLHLGKAHTLHVFSSLSFYYQVPQYSLMGIAEVFSLVASAEFVLSRAPRQVRCTAIGFYFFVTGVGNYLGACLIYALRSFDLYYDDPSTEEHISTAVTRAENSKAYVFFICVDVVIFVNMLIFVFIKNRNWIARRAV